MSFNNLKVAVQQRFNRLKTHNLYVMATDKDEMWNAYIRNIPASLRQEYTCNCCRQFIKQYGSIVAVVDGNIFTLWDLDEVEDTFLKSVEAMQGLVYNADIRAPFLSKTVNLGTDNSRSLLVTWGHFFLELPQARKYRGSKSIASTAGTARTERNVFERAMTDLNVASGLTVLELIEANNLYRGAENKHIVQEFVRLKGAYVSLTEARDKAIFCWEEYARAPRIWGTSIGTLLRDLTTGLEASEAVRKFEAIVAPSNYKRPTALITKSMLDKAQEAVKELGYETALERQYATLFDIPVNDVIFTDQSHDNLGQTSLFDVLEEDLVVNPKKFEKVEEVLIKDFLKELVPLADSVEILLESRHSGSLVTLVAPAHAGSLSMFPWDNGLSWAYSGGLADSMKQRVKDAGGRVDGVLRFSLQWNEGMLDQSTDLDAHCLEPTDNLIYYPEQGRVQQSSGKLDVDNTNPGAKIAVENIIWTDREKMPKGVYKFLVHNYSQKNSVEGFRCEIEFGGVTRTFSYDKPLRGSQKVAVASVTLDAHGHFTIEDALSGSAETSTRKMWGMSTNKFHKVETLMRSPNHWGNNASGNEHLFFIIEGAKAEEAPRGVFNEFLKPELHEHRKVFEMLANKMAVKPLGKGEREVSGLGFSSTQENEVILKVTTGGSEKVVRVKF